LVLRGAIVLYEWLRLKSALARRIAACCSEMLRMTVVFLWTLVGLSLLACLIFNPTVIREPNLLLDGTARGDEVEFINVMWRILAVGTVKNFVSVSLRAYEESYFYFIYFAIVIVIFTFIAAFMFAVVLARYGQLRVTDRQREVYQQREALVFTFFYLLKAAGTSRTPPESPRSNADVLSDGGTTASRDAPRFRRSRSLNASADSVSDSSRPGHSRNRSFDLLGAQHTRSRSVNKSLDMLKIPQHARSKSVNKSLENLSALARGRAQPTSESLKNNAERLRAQNFSVDSFASMRAASPPTRQNSSQLDMRQKISFKAEEFAELRNVGTIGLRELKLVLAEYSLVRTQALTIRALLWRIGRLAGYGGAWPQMAEQLLEVLSNERPGRITESEFLQLAEVMRLNERGVIQHFAKREADEPMNSHESISLTERLRRAATELYSSPYLRLASDFMLVVHAILLIGLYQAVPIGAMGWHYVQGVFLLFTVTEFVIGSIAWGVFGYAFNFSLEWLLLVITITTRIAFVLSLTLGDRANYRFLVPSVTRFITLPFRLAAGKLVFAVIVGIGRDMWEIAVAMFGLGYFYSAIGYWIFGGQLYRSNELLDGTDYSRRDFFAHNFNTLPRSMTVLFQLTFLNDWPTTLSGMVAVTSTAAPFYFLVWFLFVVAILLNILTSAVTRPYVILRTDRPKLSAACRSFGLGQEVVKTFLWKEADLVDRTSAVWNKKLRNIGRVKTQMQDLEDDAGVAVVGGAIRRVSEKMKSRANSLQRTRSNGSVPLTPRQNV